MRTVMVKKTAFTVWTLICLLSSTRAQKNFSDTAQQLNKVMDLYGAQDPGAQVLVARGNQILFESVRGLAHLEHGIAWTTATKSEAGSVSKQFTAAAILLLEKRGQLKLSDRLSQYFPELPSWGKEISIQHLLHHTSGLKDWGSITDLAGWPRGTIALNNLDVLDIIARQPNLNNAPGAEFIYSNSNYNLMALLVERVSGQSLAQFTAKELFQPAGMTATTWRDDQNRVVPNRATAYSKTGSAYVTNMPNESAYGNGGLLTTCQDLLRWTRYYLVEQKPLGEKPLERQLLNNGTYQQYAMGLFVDTLLGQYRISHSGATAGYRANLEFYPNLDLTIVWLSNNATGSFGTIPAGLREVFLGKATTSTPTQA
ncbi:MAG: class A beta-lactamase-related serine hydrolase, partial [Sphingobacteriia bacterium]